MSAPFERTHYDVVVAGARCAGASTAMLLAREGLRVLVVDPARYGSDTLSTHALMRGAVLQLHRWGLLDAVRNAGTPAISSTTFHYGSETIEIPIKPRDGVDALYAPRRTVLDPMLVDAAIAAGAEVVNGHSLVDLVRDDGGRVRGARIAGSDQRTVDVSADLVVGADGLRSRVARLLGLAYDYSASHAASSIYGYLRDVRVEGYHWFYEPGLTIGTIPTNHGETCLFVLIPQEAFNEGRGEGLASLFRDRLSVVAPELAEDAASRAEPIKLRAFAGAVGFLRRATGPGWVLVGDAAYFRDPITAHGISDALREAELVARAITGADSDGLEAYQAARDASVMGFLDTTDRLASFEWSLEEAKDLHLTLSRQMNAQVDLLRALG
jgi:flavin-dependent dehydrogenase